MTGPYRKCPEHGWLHIEEYTVAPDGETICPMCETATHGHYPEVRARRTPGGPTHRPRDRFVEAAAAYNREHHDGYGE